jgi:hypothetical protein
MPVGGTLVSPPCTMLSRFGTFTALVTIKPATVDGAGNSEPYPSQPATACTRRRGPLSLTWETFRFRRDISQPLTNMQPPKTI